MKTFVLAAVSSLTLTTFSVLPARAFVGFSSPANQGTTLQFGQVAQRQGLGDAQEVCVEAAEDRGLQVREILSIEPVAGGAEVQMQVGQRQSGSFVVGCDYSSGTGNVELYRLEGVERNNPNRGSSGDSGDWRRSYSDGSSVRNPNQAEEIARSVVGQQLGIRDPYSDVVRIDDVNRTDSNRAWEVKGRVNGAPFVVRIRSSDAYVLGFDLF